MPRQYKVKDVAGFVIQDTKEDLKLKELSFTSINEFSDYFMKDYAKDEDKRTVSTPIITKKGDNNYWEVNVSYVDKDSTALNDYVCIVETPTSFYKIICWSVLAVKENYKSDFQKTAFSLKD